MSDKLSPEAPEPAAGDAGQTSAADGASTAQETPYELPDSLRPFEAQIRPHMDELQAHAREHGLSQAEFDAKAAAAFGDPGGEMAALEREFGTETAQTLEAVTGFATELAGHHRDVVERLATSAAGVRLLNALRVGGAGGVDLEQHSAAVKKLHATEAGKGFLHALQTAAGGIAMPGIAAAPPRTGPEGEAPAPEGRKSEAELRAMMQDPRYWRDRDPAFVNEVSAGFKRLYPSQIQTAPIAPSGGR